MLKQSTEKLESLGSVSLVEGMSGIIRNRVLRFLAVLALIAPACKDEKVTDIQEALRRLSELCINENPSGYCNDDDPKSVIKFAIADGKIVYDSEKRNFVYKGSGKTVAEIRSDEEVEEEAKKKLEGWKRKIKEGADFDDLNPDDFNLYD